jgi:hypothetical protein
LLNRDSATGLASGINPRFFACRTMPSVPIMGIASVAAQRHASPSSSTARIPSTRWHREMT